MELRNTGIVTIAYYFDPDGAVGALRPRRFHRYLRELGYDSRVIGALVSRTEDDPSVVHLPDVLGELWERRTRSIASGQQPEALSLDAQVERFIRKVFMPGHAGWIWSRHAATYAKRLVDHERSITTVLSSYPALGTHLAALQLARRAGLRWIADFRDPFPPYGSTLGLWSQKRLEALFFRHADAIIANTEPVADRWRKQYPWAENKIHLIWNGYDPDSEIQPLPVPPGNQKRIVHTGHLYAGRNANAIVAAIARLRKQSVPGVDTIKLVLAGPVSEAAGVDESLYGRAVSEGWLEFNRDSVPRAEALRLAQEADGLLLLQPQSAILVPAKLFEYTSIGRPILALAPGGSSIEWILQRSGLPFVCVHPEDPVDTASNKIVEFLKFPNRSVKANDWFREHFDARRQTAQLAEIIETVNRSKPARKF